MGGVILVGLLALGGRVSTGAGRAPALGNWDFYSGDYSRQGVIGNSLPGTWRPFSDDSLWNTPIAADAKPHPESQLIMSFAASEAENLRLARSYTIPVWVVNSQNVPLVKVRSDVIFDTWDRDRDGWSDVGAPVTVAMWAEPTKDGHLSIVDPLKKTAWEFSRFEHDGTTPRCTTFNIWDLSGKGMASSEEGRRWSARGGRGSGFPLIAGLIRPEELAAGEIRHALVFTFSKNRRAADGRTIFLPPASRSDGRHAGHQYPIEGMRFQLDPALTERDFDRWGLNREGKVLARALQKYGMFVGDNGGAMALQPQLLGPTAEEHQRKWQSLFPGFYSNVGKIPTSSLRVVYTGEPIIK